MAVWTDAELSDAFGDARRGCADRLFTLLRPSMLASVESRFPRWLRPRLDPEDVVQTAQTSLFVELDKVRGNDPAALRAWVRRVTQRALEDCIRFHERGRRDAHEETQAAVELVDPVAGLRWEVVALAEALQDLPERERRVVRLHRLQGRPWREVMHELELPLSMCRKLEAGGFGRLTRRVSVWSARISGSSLPPSANSTA